FGMKPASGADELAVGDHADSESGPERQNHGVVVLLGGAHPMFGEDRGGGVVLEPDRTFDLLRKEARDRRLAPASGGGHEVGRVQEQSLDRIHGARGGHADALDPAMLAEKLVAEDTELSDHGGLAFLNHDRNAELVEDFSLLVDDTHRDFGTTEIVRQDF